MKIEELKSMIDEYSADGEINHEELNKAINSKFDVLIESKVTKAKNSAKSENIAEFLNEQGYENIDQFTAFVKNSKATSSELSEKASRLEAELSKIQGEYKTAKQLAEEYQYMGKLDDVAPQFRKFVMSEVKGLVNDEVDFETAKKGYLEKNAQYVKDSESIVTKVPKGDQPKPQADGVLGILERKHGIKLE